jgi:hypothetical protein
VRFDFKICFAIDLVTAGAAGHEYPKQRLQKIALRLAPNLPFVKSIAQNRIGFVYQIF